ncbi:MAG TPA: response regulator [bacterium]|nr:response regulator [bacterium]
MENKEKTILIVEDDPTLLEMYKEKLRISGFRVITAKDGKAALQRIKDMPNLVLLDILMPGLNGFELLKRVKADPETKDIPIVVLTNVGSESVDSDKQFAMSLGANDYLVKSLNTPDDVVARIQKIIA